MICLIVDAWDTGMNIINIFLPHCNYEVFLFNKSSDSYLIKNLNEKELQKNYWKLNVFRRKIYNLPMPPSGSNGHISF